MAVCFVGDWFNDCFDSGWLNGCLLRWWLVEWLFASLVVVKLLSDSLAVG